MIDANEFTDGSKIQQVFKVLADQKWHCRACEYEHVGSTQIAGSGGIQGLKRGNATRSGLDIKSGYHYCERCETTTRQDRWTGNIQQQVSVGSMPKEFKQRVLQHYASKDVIENTSRQPNELTVDHKLPMIRWSSEMSQIQTDYDSMGDEEIKKYFQLLKASNGRASHNLLKSRACERCLKTRKRGTPFGIQFFYRGGPNWEGETDKDHKGCFGCGWFDFDKWRRQLNRTLKRYSS